MAAAQQAPEPWSGGASSGAAGRYSILSHLMNTPPDAAAVAAEAAADETMFTGDPHRGSLLSGTIPALLFRRFDQTKANLSTGEQQQHQAQTQLCPADLLCECGGADGRLLGSVSAYVLKWTKVAIRKLANAYLSSPVLLAITPLLLGLALGFVLGRRWETRRSTAELSKSGKSEKAAVEGAGGNHGNAGKQREAASFLSKVTSSWPLVRMAVTTGRDMLWHAAATKAMELSGMLLLRPPKKDVDTGGGASSKFSPPPSRRDGDGGRGSEADVASTAAARADGDDQEDERDTRTRSYLLSDAHTTREANVDPTRVPRHIAVIMDGNRRYGRSKYGSATRGHWDGSRTLVDFSKWCIAEGVQVLTVYAFSTENWNRSPDEVDALMTIFVKYCEELRVEAIARDIRLRVLSTETERIPEDVKAGLDRMVQETRHCSSFVLNICLSYGGRGEIVNACRSIARDVREGDVSLEDVTEASVGERMLTAFSPGERREGGGEMGEDGGEGGSAQNAASAAWPTDPDIVIRTSGEVRLSNFLLWQAAYSELFFVDKPWPALRKDDLLDIIRSYATGRNRRFGK